MKRKIARLQRWLDRFSAACESRRWDSAIVEADCLSAEVREIREELWDMLENGETAKQGIFSRNAVTMSLRSVVIALFIILVSTMPLAVEADKPLTAAVATAPADSGSEHLSWVTEEEDQLLEALRADLNNNNTSAIMFAASPAPSAAKNTGAKKTLPAVRPETRKSTQGAVSDAGLDAEDLLALIQIGERALRGGDPVIKVIE